ncbi:MAG: glycosyltransferase family 1 protein [Thermoanaerobaculia bacterium]
MELRDPITGEPMSFARRVRRALARRFPRARTAYVQLRHRISRAPARLRRFQVTTRWLQRTVSDLWRRRRERRLTVGVDVTAFWEPLTGVGWYLYRLLEHLAERDDLRIRLYGPTIVASPDLEGPVVALPTGPALEKVSYRVPLDLILPAGWVIRCLRRLEPLLIAAEGNQVLFAPNYFLPRRFSLARAARVATIHDLGLRKVPWTLRRETLQELTTKLEHSLFEASHLISVSGAVRDELARYRYARPERVTVVYHGPGQLAAVEPTGLPEGTPPAYALHVGTLEPRKNVLTLLEAWRQLRRGLPGAPTLVLCGRFGWKSQAIQRAVRLAEREGWLRHLGYVSEGELASLYRQATLVVFPSLYEGFGLPALEAQWAGAPLVCSDLPVLREVAGDAALYAPPDRPDLLAESFRRVLSEPALRQQLVERGRARIESFSWASAARRTAAVWGRAAGRPLEDSPPSEGPSAGFHPPTPGEGAA